MVLVLDDNVETPELETPQVADVEAPAKVKAPLVKIDREIFRSESNLLAFEGYIANNFTLESKVDGATGETVTKTRINKKTKAEEVVEVKVQNQVKRPQSVGFAIKNLGADEVIYWVDKYLDTTGKSTLITEDRFEEMETRELAVGEVAYLTKYSAGLLLGEDRFGSRLGAGVMLPALKEKALEAGVEFDEDMQLSVNVRAGSQNSLKGANVFLSVVNNDRIQEGTVRISVPVTRYPLHIATEVGSEADGYPAVEGATVKPEFAESFATLGEKVRGKRAKSGSADINASARRLAYLSKRHKPVKSN